MRIIDQVSQPVTALSFAGLFKAGAAAAWIAALLFRRNLDAEWFMLRVSGVFREGPLSAPAAVNGWFALLRQHPLVGLVLLNFFDLVNDALLGLIFLAVVLALRKQRFAVLLAGALALAGISAAFATNQALTLLSLSKTFASASAAEQERLLAAGQAALAVHLSNNFAGAGFHPSFFAVTLAGLILSAAMLRGAVFSTGTAVIGIIANSLGLSYYLLLPFTPALTWLPLSLSAVFLLAWYLALGVRLWSLK